MPPALKRMETGLSSNAMPVVTGFRVLLATTPPALALFLSPALLAQTSPAPAPSADTAAPSAADAAAAPAPAAEAPQRINLMVTKPRGEVNQAQAQQCRNAADAGTISGEIVVCAETEKDQGALTGTRKETQKRYAQETANKGKPPTPDLFGIPDNGKGIGFGKAPPPAITVDFSALPKAPAGSDADRIAQGLQPIGADEELSEEQERARREAEGIKTTVPPRPSKRKKGG